MRKMSKLFSLILALALLMTSTFALAEEADLTMQTITLNNIQVSANGSPLLDLSGLSMSMGGGVDPATGKAIGQLSLLGGDQAAATATIATDAQKLVLNVNGLTKPLTLDLEAAMQLLTSEEMRSQIIAMMTEGMTEEQVAAFNELLAACEELGTEESMEAFTASMNAYMEKVMNITQSSVAVPEAVKHTFGEAGELDAQFIAINISEEEFAEIIKAAAEFYDSNPAVLKIVSALMKLGAEEGEAVEFTTFSDAIASEQLPPLSLTGEIYESDDGQYTDLVVNTLISGEPMSTVTALIFDDGTKSTFDMAITAEVDETYTDAEGNEVAADQPGKVEMTISGLSQPAEGFDGKTEITVTATVNDGESESAEITFWAGPDETNGDMTVLTIASGDQTIGFATASTDTHKSFSVYDDEFSFEIGFDAQSVSDVIEGQLYAKMAMGEESYEITCDVKTAAVAFSAAELDELLNADGIDVLTITEDDLTTLSSELTMVAFQAIGVLGQNVPALASLMGGLTSGN